MRKRRKIHAIDTTLAVQVATTEVAVITPYAGQVAVLRRRLPPAVEVNTVNAFQVRACYAVMPQAMDKWLGWCLLADVAVICHLHLRHGVLVNSWSASRRAFNQHLRAVRFLGVLVWCRHVDDDLQSFLIFLSPCKGRFLLRSCNTTAEIACHTGAREARHCGVSRALQRWRTTGLHSGPPASERRHHACRSCLCIGRRSAHPALRCNLAPLHRCCSRSLGVRIEFDERV